MCVLSGLCENSVEMVHNYSLKESEYLTTIRPFQRCFLSLLLSFTPSCSFLSKYGYDRLHCIWKIICRHLIVFLLSLSIPITRQNQIRINSEQVNLRDDPLKEWSSLIVLSLNSV